MRPVLPRLTLRWLACLLALLSACAPTPGGVHVTVTSAMQPNTDFDQLSVTAFLADGMIPLANQTFQGEALKLPATVNFVSGSSTAAGTVVVVEATAEAGGEIVSTVRGEATLTAREGAELTLTLPPKKPVVVTDGGNGVVEICDNGVDDDGDGRADCADTQCNGRTCLPGGMTCSGQRCNCTGGSAGTASERTGFEARVDPQAIRLTEGDFAGHIAIVGGRVGPTPSATVELVSLTGSNLLTSSLNTARESFALLALPDGGLLVAGGIDGTTARSSYEFFPGADGGFESVTISPALRAVSSSALLGDGALIFAGGQLQDIGGGGQVTSSVVRVFLQDASDGGAGGQVEVGQMSDARSGFGAVLSTGELLMSGGSGTVTSDRTDLIGPDGAVRTGPVLPVKIADSTAVRLKDGRVLVLGGRVEISASAVASARAFIVSSSASGVSVRELSPMLSSKVKPRAALLDNGWVYVDDGSGGSTKPEWFDPASETFVAAVVPSPARTGYAVVSAGSNSVALVGGGTSGTADGKMVTLTLQCP